MTYNKIVVFLKSSDSLLTSFPSLHFHFNAHLLTKISQIFSIRMRIALALFDELFLEISLQFQPNLYGPFPSG